MCVNLIHAVQMHPKKNPRETLLLNNLCQMSVTRMYEDVTSKKYFFLKFILLPKNNLMTLRIV